MGLGEILASAAKKGMSDDVYSCSAEASDGGKGKKKKCKTGITAELNKGGGMSKRTMSSTAKKRLKKQKTFKRI